MCIVFDAYALPLDLPPLWSPLGPPAPGPLVPILGLPPVKAPPPLGLPSWAPPPLGLRWSAKR
eukprot:8157241-Pyramimonas_sp.AAC.1